MEKCGKKGTNDDGEKKYMKIVATNVVASPAPNGD